MTPVTVEAVRTAEQAECSAEIKRHIDSIPLPDGRVCVSCKWAGRTYKTGPYVGYRDCMMPAVTTCANLVPLTAPSGEPMGCPCHVKKEAT